MQELALALAAAAAFGFGCAAVRALGRYLDCSRKGRTRQRDWQDEQDRET